MKIRRMYGLALSGIVTAWLMVDGTLNAALACNYYASPTGGGNGLSQSSSFQIKDFWSVAKPGDTLCLLDGHYTGSNSMILPPQGLRGTQSSPITVRALNDGDVTINGQGARPTVQLNTNDYFILEGFNAHHSNRHVINIYRSNHNIVRRVAAWDAVDGNTNIFGIHASNNNLLEDCAGWGVARKIFSASQGGNHTTIRRGWGRWEKSDETGPKMTYEIAYNNYSLILENSIGTWDTSMTSVNQPHGIIAVGRLDGDKNAHSKMLGNIFYLKSNMRYQPSQIVRVSNVDSFEIADTVVYIEEGSHLNKRTFLLADLQSGTANNLIASSLTSIGGAGLFISSQWETADISESNFVDNDNSVFDSSSGAVVCHRYQNGRLTNTPLWPWPMNQRIIDAMIDSGRTPVDVTRTIEQMFGPIPNECR